MSFDLAAARAFADDHHANFDELPEQAEAWLRAALDEIERLIGGDLSRYVEGWPE